MKNKHLVKDYETLAKEIEQANINLVHELNMLRVRYLTTHIEDYNKWLSYQNTHKTSFKKEVNYLIGIELIIINKAISKAVDTLGLTKKQVNVIKQENNKALKNLSVSVTRAFDNDIVSIKAKRYATFDTTTLSQRIQNQFKQTGINGKEYAVYSNGKKYRFETYQNMATRTALKEFTVNNSVNDVIEDGIVFFTCNCFDDCAKDHIDMQNQGIFITERWESVVSEADKERVAEWVNSHSDYLTLEQAKGEEGNYFGLRPNCRHQYMALSVNEVIGHSAKEIQKKNGLIEGKPNEEARNRTQKQRYYERQERKYKELYQAQKKLVDRLPKDDAGYKEAKSFQLQYRKKYLDYKNELSKLVPSQDRKPYREDFKTLK